MPDGSIFPSARPLKTEDRSLTNAQAEQALLGALLTKPELIEALPPTFRADHYGYADHSAIHAAIAAVGRPGGPAALAVMQSMAINDPEVRGYIANLLTSVIGLKASTISQYAEIVTDLYRRRQLVALADRMRGAAFANAGDAPCDATIAISMSELDNLCGSGDVTSRSVSLDDAMDAAMADAEAAAHRQGPAGLSTGSASIDEALGGLEDGTLTVLGGRPGMGKSAMGWQWSVSVARQGVGVVAISLEMSAKELGRRALATVSGVPVWRMKRGKLQATDWTKLKAGRAELNALPLTIEDGGGLTAAGIGLKVRAAHRKHGVGLIMVDHLHIVRPEDADARHGGTWAVGRISGAMKRLAKEHSCPVLLLAQLNRAVEGRDDKRPNLSDLRQSGDIEQDADAVALVYRAEYYLAKEPEKIPGETAEKYANRKTQWHHAKAEAVGKAELIFAKVRDGAPGTVNLQFHGETTSFSEAEHVEF